MPVDRDATLKRAEKLLRQGKLDGAIQEYVRLVEDQPRDWNAMNTLGDLYARAGNAERAVAQFTRIADHLHDEGFYPKAAALYKKALKTQADHEPSLLRLGELAARQGLVADAKLYLNQLARLRRARGDEPGASECLLMLGGLPDAELKLAAARAAVTLGDTARAGELFLDASEIFEKNGRAAEALDALVAAAGVDATDVRLRTRAALQCLEAGDVDRARLFLSRESAGDDPDLLLALGRLELAAGRHDDARSVLSRLLVVAPGRSADVVRIADELAAAGNVDAAFDCADAAAETALLAGDMDAALGALQSFLAHGPHIPALMKLVEVAVDIGREDLTADAQARLADAYLDGGLAAEARAIAEDLVARDPANEAHVERLRRALRLAGEADVDAIVARHLEAPGDGADDELADVHLADVAGHVDETPSAPTAASDELTVHHEIVLDASALDESVLDDPLLVSETALDEPVIDTGAPGVLAAEPPEGVPPPFAHAPEEFVDAPEGPVEARPTPVEVDLSDALTELASGGTVFTPAAVSDTPRAGDAGEPPGASRDARVGATGGGGAADAASTPPHAVGAEPPAVPDAPGPTKDLESVFEQMRTRVREHQGTAPAAQLERGLRQIEEGRIAEAIPDLEAAARAPMLRFPAATALGRAYASRGELGSAVEWLERAAEAPAPTEREALAVLYELADALARLGESARALAVLLEIDAGRAPYRDVPARIEALTRVQAGSHRS